MPELRNEINHAVREVLVRKGIKLNPGISPDLIFTAPEDISDALSAVVLPGDNKC